MLDSEWKFTIFVVYTYKLSIPDFIEIAIKLSIFWYFLPGSSKQFPQNVFNFLAIKWTCRKRQTTNFNFTKILFAQKFFLTDSAINFAKNFFRKSCKKSTHLFSSSNFCSSIKSCNFCECSELFIASVAVCSPSAWCEQYSKATLAL